MMSFKCIFTLGKGKSLIILSLGYVSACVYVCVCAFLTLKNKKVIEKL